MTTADNPDTLAALALVPEQIPAYVRAVAGSELRFCKGFAVYLSNGSAVLAGYPVATGANLPLLTQGTLPPDPALEGAIAEISRWPGLAHIHVLAPARPEAAPVQHHEYTETRDSYLALDLPCFAAGENYSGVGPQKLRNMLRRASRDCAVGVEPWGHEMQALVKDCVASRAFEAGTRHIFGRLARYATTGGVKIFTARSRHDKSLQGFCLGDFTPLATAFYMFAFRKPDATPGTADLLLHALLEEASTQGYERVNLGLSMNRGVGFFKEKWGARPFLPLVESSWPLSKKQKSFWQNLVAKKTDLEADRGRPPAPQPLAPHLRGPGVWESVRGLVRGEPKLFDVLQIEVSSSCMARCTYCPRTTMAEVWKKSLMSAETYTAAWPLFRQSRRVHLQGWGEPLLHPRFFDLVELARRADCQVSTTTCGLVMNESLALKLVESGVDIVAFSLAGVDEEGNRSRGAGTFAKATEAIRLLQNIRKRRMAAHLEIHLAYLVLASQIDHLRGLPELLDDLDAHAAVVSTMDYIPSQEMAHEAFMPWEREKIEKARAVLEHIAAQAASRGRNIYYSLPEHEPGNRCLEHIERSLFIAADGAISPCIYVNLPTQVDDPLRRVYGSVNQPDPLAVWKNAEYTAFRQGLLHGAPDANCVNCPKRYAVGNRPQISNT